MDSGQTLNNREILSNCLKYELFSMGNSVYIYIQTANKCRSEQLEWDFATPFF